MNSKNHSELEKAKAYFYQWRLLDAYSIFRRYYDRLPFKPEQEHTEYIGIFVRTLSELGKQYELKFYMSALEKHYEKNPSAEIGYQLAIIYIDADPPQLKTAKSLLETVVKSQDMSSYVAKAKMALAYCYDVLDDDVATCRKLIYSIDDSCLDEVMKSFLMIWKAKVLRDEANYDGAMKILDNVLEKFSPEMDWYTYFYARTIQAGTLIKQQRLTEGREVLEDLKIRCEGKYWKSFRRKVDAIERMMNQSTELGILQLDRNGSKVRYAGSSLDLKAGLPSQKLLLILLKKKYIDKQMIVKTLYDRQYKGRDDDALIYYHIHSLRKYLKRAGLPKEAISNEGMGYRLMPKVETV
jgi:hypothetical protein